MERLQARMSEVILFQSEAQLKQDIGRKATGEECKETSWGDKACPLTLLHASRERQARATVHLALAAGRSWLFSGRLPCPHRDTFPFAGSDQKKPCPPAVFTKQDQLTAGLDASEAETAFIELSCCERASSGSWSVRRASKVEIVTSVDNVCEDLMQVALQCVTPKTPSYKYLRVMLCFLKHETERVVAKSVIPQKAGSTAINVRGVHWVVQAFKEKLCLLFQWYPGRGWFPGPFLDETFEAFEAFEGAAAPNGPVTLPQETPHQKIERLKRERREAKERLRPKLTKAVKQQMPKVKKARAIAKLLTEQELLGVLVEKRQAWPGELGILLEFFWLFLLFAGPEAGAFGRKRGTLSPRRGASTELSSHFALRGS
ncbi:hypothetical protein AK812_SmicGene43197 [Symbiodinium microadriaticum]|uniref:Uncharacterized protein n=1 Tax=Symbiodinium microadriaticum TaxID=2951 RepID=A0A1Q9C1M4_SYMMI|nr:hypothetical protein AK812_SmicGene43197 [Symbiodinium microadriaticum]